MEASPNQHTVRMGEDAERIISLIDTTLADYDESERLRKTHRATDHILAQGLVAIEPVDTAPL